MKEYPLTFNENGLPLAEVEIFFKDKEENIIKKSTQAMIDTGAEISSISEIVISGYNGPFHPSRKEILIGNEVRSVNCVEIKIKIPASNPDTIKIFPIINKDLNDDEREYDIIIGVDGLKELGYKFIYSNIDSEPKAWLDSTNCKEKFPFQNLILQIKVNPHINPIYH